MLVVRVESITIINTLILHIIYTLHNVDNNKHKKEKNNVNNNNNTLTTYDDKYYKHNFNDRILNNMLKGLNKQIFHHHFKFYIII